jgi:hypothetical protein
MVLQQGSNTAAQPRRSAFRFSTAFLLLAVCGLPYHFGGDLLPQLPEVANLMLVKMAPVWALLGCVLSTIYLVLTVWRPYNAVQHLIELAIGVLLTVLMLPVF